jgi:hypothetical protein
MIAAAGFSIMYSMKKYHIGMQNYDKNLLSRMMP